MPIRARKLAGAQTPSETIEAANQQSAALARLLVIVENYPQLQVERDSSTGCWTSWQAPKIGIAVERMRYNERVQEYNTSRRQFPGVITAKIFSFKDYPLFEAPEWRAGAKVSRCPRRCAGFELFRAGD